MAEGAAGCIFYDSGFTDCGFYSFLYEASVKMIYHREDFFFAENDWCTFFVFGVDYFGEVFQVFVPYEFEIEEKGTHCLILG